MVALDVRYGTKVVVTEEDVKTPLDAIPVNTGDEITIHNLDGLYCNGVDKDGDRIYISVFTQVEPCM